MKNKSKINKSNKPIKTKPNPLIPTCNKCHQPLTICTCKHNDLKK